MSAPKFTPGPWRIIIDGTCSGAWPHIVGPDFNAKEVYAGEAIAELSTTHIEKVRSGKRWKGYPGTIQEKPGRFEPTNDHDEIMANAHLIAAAPKLYGALEELANAADESLSCDHNELCPFAQRLRDAVIKARAELAKAVQP